MSQDEVGTEGKEPKELYPETPFAKEVREYVEGLHGCILTLSDPIIHNNLITGWSCAVKFWMQTSYNKKGKQMIRQLKYGPNYTSFVCIDEVKAFMAECARIELRFYLDAREFATSREIKEEDQCFKDFDI